MAAIKVFEVGDFLVMKKQHACGDKSSRFEVLALGSDIKVRCVGCGRTLWVPRVPFENQIRQVVKGENA